jgi:hypothetical protein
VYNNPYESDPRIRLRSTSPPPPPTPPDDDDDDDSNDDIDDDDDDDAGKPGWSIAIPVSTTLWKESSNRI